MNAIARALRLDFDILWANYHTSLVCDFYMDWVWNFALIVYVELVHVYPRYVLCICRADKLIFTEPFVSPEVQELVITNTRIFMFFLFFLTPLL